MNEYFETIKCENYEVFHLNYHQKRVASTIGKNHDLLKQIQPPNSKLLKCKVVYNEDEITDVSFTPYKKKEISSLKIIRKDEINYKQKSTNRAELESLYKQKGRADDILIVKQNLITDTTIANIAICVKNQWLTPKTALLQGTTRQRYIDNGTVEELDVTVELFKKAEKIALLNAMIGFDILEHCEVY